MKLSIERGGLKIAVAVIVQVLTCSFVYSQQDTAHHDFLPTGVGNTWIYDVRSGVGHDLLRVTTVSDSVDVAGNHFMNLDSKTRNAQAQYPWFKYYKVDTAGNIFTNATDTITNVFDRMEFYSSATLHESWVPDSVSPSEVAQVVQIADQVVFAESALVVSVGYYPLGPPIRKSYASTIGITYVGSADAWYEFFLKGAVIDGQSKGDTSFTVADTLKRPDFYPHHLGDTWIYYVRNGAGDDTLQVKIVSDSSDAFGRTLVVYSVSIHSNLAHATDYWPYLNQMIDSSGNIYMKRFADSPYDRLQYMADAILQHWWNPDTAETFEHVKLESTPYVLVFGDTVTSRNFGHYFGSVGFPYIKIYSECYADRFGLVSRWGSDLGYTITLMAAVINGHKFGDTVLTSVGTHQNSANESVTELLLNYPNPFNGQTTIAYSLSEYCRVKISVYDILGRMISELTDAYQSRGNHSVRFDSRGLASGVYFCRLQAGTTTKIKKLTVQK